MVGSLIGGALSLATTAYGGWKSYQAANEAKKINQDWYNRNYYADTTQRADAQRILTLTQESVKRANRAARGRAAVMGGTEESVAATKQANANAMADAAGQLAANAEGRKQAIDQQHMATQMGLAQQQSANIANATGAAASALGNAGMGVDDWLLEQQKLNREGKV